ncbi:Methyltransferase domain-containing protein [Mucilaginibacter gossypiicola]|uniref:Methyltransferase domain-containing protein n=1 Tax=Mucilaginibacter gossypiicola TaxID=551995 RepID=A0A1H8QI70_9SPHI|nr:class I SAM-dependent methyltransferase [Mucilaginibacter gossypiicola]SEO53919.1 Methyltransferase domain-containing protein [Mucilaginibacter gossypiicola]
MSSNNLRKLYGNIDIYLFDQLLKGRFDNCHSVLDAGCGNGRNIAYFLQNGFKVYGVDQSEHAVELSKRLSAELCPDHSPDNFKLAAVENLPFSDGQFDLVICSAVLHFANDAEHFDSMLRSLWRVLKPGGYFFARLASDIGIETSVQPLGNYRYLLPDGSERFLVNEEILLEYTRELGAQLYEPIKTTNVQNLRCMTTWCIQKQ